MIKFDPEIEEPKLLRKAVLWARRNKDWIPSLSHLAKRRTALELTELGKAWQKIGLGRLIEVSEDGQRSVLFSLNEEALKSVDIAYQRSFAGWLRAMPRSEWVSIGTFFVSCGALAVAILAYLKK